uniref:Uncharacterized protein n=1 Tax=Setaria italica TaxID=4555 RepID=K3ZYS1_SETIT
MQGYMLAKGPEMMLLSQPAYQEFCYFGNTNWKAHDKCMVHKWMIAELALFLWWNYNGAVQYDVSYLCLL